PTRTTSPRRWPTRPICWGRASRRRSIPRTGRTPSTSTRRAVWRRTSTATAKSRTDGGGGGTKMSNLAYDHTAHGLAEDAEIAAMSQMRPVPRISIQAFCETESVASPIERAGEDRRMAKAHLKVHMGGIPTAIEFYQTAPTPNLMILESR